MSKRPKKTSAQAWAEFDAARDRVRDELLKTWPARKLDSFVAWLSRKLDHKQDRTDT